jgi:hypothetical protein
VRFLCSLSQDNPSPRNGSSGEGRPGSAGKEQRRHSTADKTLRYEVECFTQALLRKPESEVPKKTCASGKKSTNRELQISETDWFAFAVYPPTRLYGRTLLMDRQIAALDAAFYCSLLLIYVNL